VANLGYKTIAPAGRFATAGFAANCTRPGFCADAERVSVALTKMCLGATAEKNLMEQVNKDGKDFDATTFTMSDGIFCDCKAKQCKEKLSGKPDAAHTRALFGK
jgi:hypothetical protein